MCSPWVCCVRRCLLLFSTGFTAVTFFDACLFPFVWAVQFIVESGESRRFPRQYAPVVGAAQCTVTVCVTGRPGAACPGMNNTCFPDNNYVPVVCPLTNPASLSARRHLSVQASVHGQQSELRHKVCICLTW